MTDAGDAGLVIRLREQRLARALTQAGLAELSGLSRKTINTIENGVFTPSVRTALVLAGVLGVAVEALFTLGPEG